MICPGPLIRWLAEQVAVPSSALAGYGTRNATRSSHRQLAIRHLGLRPFVPDDRGTAIDLAARAAFHTDEGRSILIGLINDMKVLRFVLPSTAALERIGLAGRARARRISAQGAQRCPGPDAERRVDGFAEERSRHWPVPSELAARPSAFHQRDEPAFPSGTVAISAGDRAAAGSGPEHSSGQTGPGSRGRERWPRYTSSTTLVKDEGWLPWPPRCWNSTLC